MRSPKIHGSESAADERRRKVGCRDYAVVGRSDPKDGIVSDSSGFWLSQKSNLADRHILYISHANAPEDAENVRVLLTEAFPKLEIEILELGAVFVTQGGPQCVAIQYIEK